MRTSVTLSLQCCLRRNHAASHAQHAQALDLRAVSKPHHTAVWCTKGERDSQKLFLHTYCNISVWVPVHPSTKYLFRLSFHPPFSSLFDTNLLIMPLISHHGSPSSHSLTPFLGLSSHPSPSHFCSTQFQPFRSVRACRLPVRQAVTVQLKMNPSCVHTKQNPSLFCLRPGLSSVMLPSCVGLIVFPHKYQCAPPECRVWK